jgi:hypothetical protein
MLLTLWRRYRPSWRSRLERKVDTIMANFDDLNAALDAATAKLDSVKRDTDSLLAEVTRLQQNPPTGMTADQQSALDTAVMKAQAIRDGLGTLDALVPDQTPAASPAAPEPAATTAPTEPAPAPAPETTTAPAETSATLPPNELNPAPAPAPADATAAPETPPTAPPAA